MIEKNKYGYFEVTNPPNQSELNEYYREKYYQTDRSTYDHEYSMDELNYFNSKIEQKWLMARDKFNLDTNRAGRLLDLGCGEGFCLRYFHDLGWDVTGIDYSIYGCLKHNPDMASSVITGDISESVQKLIAAGKIYDIIWLDNVLEHVLSPSGLLTVLSKISSEKTILIIEVPNDYSQFQFKLIQENLVPRRYWEAVPEHISYFNLNGLKNLALDSGWLFLDAIADFPIEFNLANDAANYIEDVSTGKAAHKQRIFIENFLSGLDTKLVIEFYKAMANLGLGRQITAFFNKNTSV